jgi:hypothetical protein
MTTITQLVPVRIPAGMMAPRGSAACAGALRGLSDWLLDRASTAMEKAWERKASTR